MRRKTIHHTVAETSYGPIRLAASEKGVCWLSFDTRFGAMRERLGNGWWVENGEIATGLLYPVRMAMRDPHAGHSIPLDLEGTPFQLKVWNLLQAIPVGQTRSYGDLARQLGSPGASRAVGAANGQNPVAVLVPCHRVIAADGTLGGYAGGLPLKQRLLEAEGAPFANEPRQASLFADL